MVRPLKVLFVSAEVAPFSTVGGLSQVSYFLPRALIKHGLDVRIFTPKYGTLDEKKFPTTKVMELPVEDLVCNVKTQERTLKGDPIVYFLENMEYFEKRANVYNYVDDPIRFSLLSRGALEFVKSGVFVPDLIHCNDWHTGYLIDYLRKIYKNNPTFKKMSAILSVHNLYQGMFDFAHASQMDFDDGKSDPLPFFSEDLIKQNALKRGVMYADLINTVSETYSREVMRPDFGWGLDELFKEIRGKVFGVLNGLDYKEFNSSSDKLIKKNFNQNNLSAREENKKDLQKEFNLNQDPNVPIVSFEGRLDYQKGLEIIMETIQFLLDEFDIQFIIMGGGDDRYRQFFLDLEKKYPGRVGTHLMPNWSLPRKIFAGSDIMLFPSYYEPGGIVAMEGMHYGAVPVARATGGLADSIINFDPLKNTGTGFLFKDFSAMSFITAMVRALETYRRKPVWQGIIKRAMTTDFSWDRTALKYLDLYERAIRFHGESLSINPPMAFKQTNT